MERKFKYHNELIEVAKFRECPFPPENLRAPDFTEDVFRFVFEDHNHPHNYIPPFAITPSRANNPNDRMKTDGYGISCFEKYDQAKTSYFNLSRSLKKFASTAGNSLSKGFVDVNDGLVDESEKNTHFNLYEFEGCDLSKKFTFIEKLIK